MNKRYNIILGFATLIAAQIVTADIHESEQQALRDLYKATNGDTWLSNDGWSTDGQINCDAYGLSCARYSDYFPVRAESWETVVGLSLANNNLNGILPSSLSTLEYLWNLDLASNKLAGPIPTDLSVRLTIDLSQNSLTGSLPDTLWHAHVYSLNLSDNTLSGNIPSELGVLGNTSRTDLVKIDLSNNRFSGPIPSELGNLAWRGRDEGVLDLSYNQLTGPLPASLGDMTLPAHIRLDHNTLDGTIPAAVLNNWVTVCQLWLGFNRFTGEIPASINQMTNLANCEGNDVALDLSFNALHSLDENTARFINQYATNSLFPETQVQDVTSLTVSSLSSESADLKWHVTDTLPSTAGGYKVYLSQTITGPFELLAELEGRKNITTRIDNLQPNTNYWAKVRSYAVIDKALYEGDIADYRIDSDGEVGNVAVFTTTIPIVIDDELKDGGSGGAFVSIILLYLAVWFRRFSKTWVI